MGLFVAAASLGLHVDPELRPKHDHLVLEMNRSLLENLGLRVARRTARAQREELAGLQRLEREGEGESARQDRWRVRLSTGGGCLGFQPEGV